MCLPDLSRGEQQSVSQAIHAGVIADGGEVLHAFAYQGANQVFRDAAKSEPANHDGGAVKDVFDGLVGVGYDFIHWIRILNESEAFSSISVLFETDG